ncbi:GntR family transcriptional regulator [Streptomyces sp. NA04227]|uniref:GntR family transcriptional regulator n=1 Tax=Streptomyces sp. NA04227 TaxID=2742136 RepID=UPI00159211C5|nr:GntR family transcriptional regulator [Streptomyces sp. NA04227]QKW10298.1 GntR family transcriptional regulator [Streptomyces sp. NA04227]
MGDKSWARPLPAVKSKADLVYDHLRGAIADGHLHPGERLNMDELARTLGVSKIPIREAVKRLESDGLLTSRVHSGVVVSGVDKAEMRGVFLARGAIEGLVARLAAEQADDKLIDSLAKAQQLMREALAEGAIDKLQQHNSEFHGLLAGATGYRILAELTEQLLFTVRRYRMTTPDDVRNWGQVIEEHETILAALREKDPAAAEAAAQAHTASQAGHEIDEQK